MLFLGLGCNIFLGLRLSCYALSAISRRLATAVAHQLYCSPRDKDADEKLVKGRMGGDGVGSREFPEEKIVLKIYFSWRKKCQQIFKYSWMIKYQLHLDILTLP